MEKSIKKELDEYVELMHEIQKEIGEEKSVKEYLNNKNYSDKPIKDKQKAKRIADEWSLKDLLNEGIIKEVVEETQIPKAIQFFTDKRNLAEQFLKVQPLYYDKGKLWWLWNFKEFKWEIIDETDILNAISEHSNANTVKSNEKNEILEALKQEARLNKPKDIKTTWIQFKDLIVDIKTGEKLKASPEYFVTNPIPWKLHEENFEETPIIDNIFKEWVGKKYIKTLHEILAYCILPDYPIHRLFCFIGAGLNGKSCFLRLLKRFVGEDNITSTELDTLLNSRFEITRLHKKLVCVMGETNFSEINKTSIIKKLTGQDTIGFEYKNKNPFEGDNYAKILIATNNLPTTTDKTIGFYRRWCIIDFPNQFSEGIDILDSIPDEEYESLALKSITVLKDVLEKRKFHKEGSINDRMVKYESKSDFLQKFLDEFIEESPDLHIWSNDFQKKFSDWCKENRHRQMSDVVLGKTMKSKGTEKQLVHAQWINEGKGGRAYAWIGIKWKE